MSFDKAREKMTGNQSEEDHISDDLFGNINCNIPYTTKNQ